MGEYTMGLLRLPDGTMVDRARLWHTIAKAKINHDVAYCGRQLLASLPSAERAALEDWATQQTGADGNRDYYIWTAAPFLHAVERHKPQHSNLHQELFTRIRTTGTGKGVIF
jgi:ferredoxin-NADP reductase